MRSDLSVIFLQESNDSSVVKICDPVRFRVQVEGW